MDDIDFFNNVDLKEVSKRTLVDLKELNYLKNEEFDKLSKAKGLGFIKIIEREYKVDLSGKRERFLEYLKEHNKDNNSEFFIAPPKTSSKIFPKALALSLVFVIIAGTIYILYLNRLSSSADVELKPEKNPIVQEAKEISGIEINETKDNNTEGQSIIDKTEENISLSNKENDNEQLLKERNTTVNKSNKTISKNLSDKLEKNNLSKSNIDKKLLQPVTKKQFNSSVSSQKSINNNQKKSITSDQVLTIVPKKRIWVGVIDLSNYKKSSYIKDSNITISKNSNFLIATGHGKFDIYYKNKMIKFNTVNPIKLLIKGGKIVKIDKKEFIKLNKGRYW